MADEKKANFATVNDFLTWTGHKEIISGIEGSKGWSLILKKDQPPVIASPYYDIKASAPYGAFKPHGHLADFNGKEGSGIAEFGFKEEGSFGVVNRRRCVPGESLADGRIIISITNNAAPDCLEEPVITTVVADEKEKIAGFSAEQWVGVYDSCRDGVEMNCAREVKKWALGE